MTDPLTDTDPDPRLDSAAACLVQGGVIVVPTDTVFGLAVLPERAASVARLFALKDRPTVKNLPVMVSDADQLRALGVRMTDAVTRLLDSPFIPGALTLAVALDGPCPDWLAGRDEIAFRIPDDAFLRALIARTGPLFVTSANRSGQPTPTALEEVLAQLTAAPDMALDGRVTGDTPSTLINLNATPPKVEREGAIPPAEIFAWLEG
ncbi:MAG TPA: threonylcarbamoyl-AMP synthase [Rhodobacteraceae bacterium]|nr:threonylcarbamoyl-AMP synthase [Paracoccaceae bacterium]